MCVFWWFQVTFEWGGTESACGSVRHGPGAEPVQTQDLWICRVQNVVHCPKSVHHCWSINSSQINGWEIRFSKCHIKRVLHRLYFLALCGLQVLPVAWLTCPRCPHVTWCCWELKEEPCLASAAPPCCPTRASSTTAMWCRRFPRSAKHRRSFCSSAEELVPEAALSPLVFRTSGERRHVWWLQSVRWPAGSTVSTRVLMARWLSGWTVVVFLFSLSPKKKKQLTYLNIFKGWLRPKRGNWEEVR